MAAAAPAPAPISGGASHAEDGGAAGERAGAGVDDGGHAGERSAATDGGGVDGRGCRRPAAGRVGNDQCEKNGSRKTNAKQKKNKISFCRIITY